MLWSVAVRCGVFQIVATCNKSMAKEDVCCSVLRCAAVCCSVLQCAALCCSVLQCVAVCFSVLLCVAVCCSVLQRVAVCCSVLQCVTVCVSVLPQRGSSSHVQQTHLTVRGSVLQCVAVCCSVFHFETSPQVQQMRVVVRGSVLRCTAVRCAVLQCVTIWPESMITADACCSVLQYVCGELLRATVCSIVLHCAAQWKETTCTATFYNGKSLRSMGFRQRQAKEHVPTK